MSDESRDMQRAIDDLVVAIAKIKVDVSCLQLTVEKLEAEIKCIGKEPARPVLSFAVGDIVCWGHNREGVILQLNPNKGTVLVRYQPEGGVRETTVMLHEREVRCKKLPGGI